MDKGIFITGLTWKSGKTYAASGIATNLAKNGLKLGVFKPIVTDCLKCSGKPYSIQGEMLKLAALTDDPPEITYPFCLRNNGLIPHLFNKELEEFNMEIFLKAFQTLKEKYQYMIVVGTGGIAEPISTELDMADLAKTINLPLVFVLNPGIDNFQLLKMAAQYAVIKGLTITGFIVNELELNTYNDKVAAQTKLIEEYLGIKFLGLIPFSEGVNPVYGELGQLIENVASNIQINELLK